MKKFLSIIILLFFLVSCSINTTKKFTDLSDEEQNMIRTEVVNNIILPWIMEAFELSTQIGEDTNVDIDEIMENKGREIRENAIKYLEENYSNIEIDYDEFFG